MQNDKKTVGEYIIELEKSKIQLMVMSAMLLKGKVIDGVCSLDDEVEAGLMKIEQSTKKVVCS